MAGSDRCRNGHPRAGNTRVDRRGRLQCIVCYDQGKARENASKSAARREAHRGHELRTAGKRWMCVTCRRGEVDPVAVRRACDGDRTVRLTPAETTIAVARLTGRGLSSTEIHVILGFCVRTVERHRMLARSTEALAA